MPRRSLSLLHRTLTCSRLFTGFSAAVGIEWFTNVNVVATVTVPRLLDFLGFKLSLRQHFSWSRSRCSSMLQPRLSSDLKMVVSPMKAFSCDIHVRRQEPKRKKPWSTYCFCDFLMRVAHPEGLQHHMIGHTDTYLLIRSSCIICRSNYSVFAHWKSFQVMLACSTYPETRLHWLVNILIIFH